MGTNVLIEKHGSDRDNNSDLWRWLEGEVHVHANGLLYTGRNSRIYTCRDQKTGTPRVVKFVTTDERRDELRWEIDIIGRLQGHANILRCYHIYESALETCFLSEYCAAGDLRVYINRTGGLGNDGACSIFISVARALAFMHSRNIIHRDIKPDNVFITLGGDVRLGDFGFARYFPPDEMNHDSYGSLPYAAPELLDPVFRPCMPKPLDLWSAGVLLYVTLYACPLADSKLSQARLYEYLLYHEIDYDILPKCGTYTVEPMAINLLKQLLRLDPMTRLSASAMIHHPWFVENGKAPPSPHRRSHSVPNIVTA